MSDKQPIYIVPENMQRTLGKDAQRNNILAAKAVADIVKTTLGPKGMDKMLVDSTGNITITNDGVTILEQMEIDHPAAKMIVDIAKTQELEVGDGTTTVAMLAGKLLEHAEKLLDKKVHPTVIGKGYRLAAERCKKILDEISIEVENQEILKKIAMTAMTGKGAETYKEKFASIILEAANQVGRGRDIDLDDITIQKIKGDGVEDSEFIRGVVIDKEPSNDAMPRTVTDAKIILIDFPLELKSPETETKISISTPQQLQDFIDSEERMLKNLTDSIIGSGATVVFCQKGIDDVAQYYLAKAGVYACRRVSKSDMEKLAKAVNTRIISNSNEIANHDLGSAQSVAAIKIGDDTMTFVRGAYNPGSVTILVRGSTQHIVAEIERAIRDGLGDVASAVKYGRVVVGGGATEIELAKRLREYARTLGGREQLAVDEFANALESIPEALAENAGLDPINILTELKKRHESNGVSIGINLLTNVIEDCYLAGIIEPLKVKTLAISSATEVAAMILRIDDVLVAGSPKNNKGTLHPQYTGLD